MQDALHFTTRYGYDDDGRRTSVTDANNNITGYVYWARGWLRTINYPQTPTQGATTMQYTYDGMGRMQSVTDQAALVTTKTYDQVGRLTSLRDACGNNPTPVPETEKMPPARMELIVFVPQR